MQKNYAIPMFETLFLTAMVLLALAWVGAVQAGNEVWKTKPFDQWTKSDIKEILYDSPWVKREVVPAEWISKNGLTEAPSMSGGSVYSPATSGGRVFQQPVGTPQGQAVFVVQWNSSRTLQEALARQDVLDGRMKESEVSQYLKVRPDIQIVVEGPDMTPFAGASQSELMSKAVLRGKQSKVQINATNVNLQQDSGYVNAVMFTFPRKTPDGKDVISPNEKGIQFTLKIKNLDLGATFDPRKMADMKGPDF